MVVKIKDISEIITRGISPKYDDDSDLLVINQKCIRNNRVDLSLARSYSEGQRVNSTKLTQIGDILVNSTGTGTLGRTALLKDSLKGLTVDSHVTIVRPITDLVNPVYLAYLFSHIESAIENLGGGSTGQTELSKTDLGNLKISMIDRGLQDRAAESLSNYDTLIDNNLRRITCLEKLAEQVYKEWFVRMRFPGFKSTKFSKGIPGNWEVLKISDLYDTSSGGTPSRKKVEYYNEGTINWVKTGELLDSFILSTEERITKEGLDKSSAKLFPAGTTIIAMYGATIGQLGILSEPAATNQACCAILNKNEFFSEYYIYSFLKSYRPHIIGMAQGAAQQNINQDEIRNTPILRPTNELMLKFNAMISPMFNEVLTLKKQIQILYRERDLLLPKLIGGELSFRQIEQRIQEIS